MGILGVIFSGPFLIGMVVGIIGQRLYCVAHAKWLDDRKPLARPRDAGGLNRLWVAGLIVAFIQGYVLLQAQQTHDDTERLTERFGRCTSDLIVGVDARGKISSGRDDLSEEQRGLFNQIDRETDKLIDKVLIVPPATLNDPQARLAWYRAALNDYDATTAPMRARSAQIDNEVAALREARRKTALPSPRCNED